MVSRSHRARHDRHPHAAAGQLRGRRHRPGGVLRAGVRRRAEHGHRQLHLRDGQAAQPAVQRADPAQLLARASRSTGSTRSRTTSRASACASSRSSRRSTSARSATCPASTGLGGSSTLRGGPAQRAARLPRRAGLRRPAGRGGLPHRDRRARRADRQAGPVRGGLRRREPLPLQPGRRRDGRAAAAGHGALETLFEPHDDVLDRAPARCRKRARGAEGEHEVQVRVAARDARPRP